MKLVSVAEMQAVEREADANGLSYAEMMENAGTNLAQVIAAEYSGLSKGGALGLVGSGNNGGDTLVALTALAQQGWLAVAYLARPRPEDDPLVERLKAAGGRILAAGPEFDPLPLELQLRSRPLLLDGLLGTGMRLPLKPELAGLLGHIRQYLAGLAHPPVVVAVDCPSGVDCDTGQAAPETLAADLTVTMAAMKIGLVRFPACDLTGQVREVGIGLPARESSSVTDGFKTWHSLQREVIDQDWVAQVLPARPRDAHKGTFGTALVVAGSLNYTGAALLAGEAAYRAGAGLVTLGVPASLHPALAGRLPEATWLLLPEAEGGVNADAARVLLDGLERVTALLIGPGFGREAPTQAFITRLFGPHNNSVRPLGFTHPAAGESNPAPAATLPPLVIDADALKLVSTLPDWPSRLPPETVLTPHPGEMSILTGLEKAEIQADRFEVAARFSREWNQVVILKGAFTLIAAPDGRLGLIPVASPALARAGTGDVLAGLVTGLRAQGLPAFEAAAAAAWIHAQAGLQAAHDLGSTVSVLAGDVLRACPKIFSRFEQLA